MTTSELAQGQPTFRWRRLGGNDPPSPSVAVLANREPRLPRSRTRARPLVSKCRCRACFSHHRQETRRVSESVLRTASAPDASGLEMRHQALQRRRRHQRPGRAGKRRICKATSLCKPAPRALAAVRRDERVVTSRCGVSSSSPNAGGRSSSTMPLPPPLRIASSVRSSGVETSSSCLSPGIGLAVRRD